MKRLLRFALMLACLAAWPHVGRASTLINGNGGDPIVYAGTNYTGGSQQIGPKARDFNPADLPGLVLWLRADQGVTVAQGPVTATGTTPPAVTLTGTPTNKQNSAIEIDITTPGVLGVAVFSWKFNTVVQQTLQLTAATFLLGTTGITANFPAGTYAANNVYTSVLVVSAWNDQSGNGNNFTQATSANQPNYNADPIGTYPAIRFTGSPMNMTCVNNIATTAPCTFITVVRPQLDTGTQGILVAKAFGSYTSLSSSSWGIFWNQNVVSVQLTDGVLYNIIANSHAFNNVDLIANGTLSNQTNGTGAPSRGGTNLGSDPTNVQYLQADIAEVILYSVSLSASQITEIRNYVSARYAFSG